MLWMLGTATAALFEDATGVLGPTGEWSNKALLDDLDGDGDLDVAFANGGNYDAPGTPVANRLFRNTGASFESWDLPGPGDLSRSLKAGDLDGDGLPDLLVSTTFQMASRLFLGDGTGFTEVSERLPQTLHSFGDVELGDVDLDGDLDAVLADWGPGNPLTNDGGRTRLWRNDGGTFTDVTESTLPDVFVRMSWDLELADVDGDLDLDVLVSSKGSAGSSLFLNDGAGAFTDASERLPQFTNNYEFAPMDVDADGDLDLVTVNDGNGLREHLLLNDGTGTYSNGNGTAWPAESNVGEDDNVVEFLDLDDDGDPDFVIGSLSGADRALINDGGVFTLADGPAFSGGGPTPGTLGLAFGDVDGDGRPDAVMAQGEAADPDRFFRGVDAAIDTHPPVIVHAVFGAGDLRARVHDRSTPVRSADLAVVLVGDQDWPLTHAGGDLWRLELPDMPAGALELCATDRAGNRACAALASDTEPPDTDAGERSCACSGAGPSSVWPLGALALVTLRLRRPTGGSARSCTAPTCSARAPSPPT